MLVLQDDFLRGLGRLAHVDPVYPCLCRMIHKAVEGTWRASGLVNLMYQWGKCHLFVLMENIAFYWAVTQMDCLICVLLCIKALFCLISICINWRLYRICPSRSCPTLTPKHWCCVVWICLCSPLEPNVVRDYVVEKIPEKGWQGGGSS